MSFTHYENLIQHNFDMVAFKGLSQSKKLKQDLRDASGPTVDSSTLHWSLIKMLSVEGSRRGS